MATKAKRNWKHEYQTDKKNGKFEAQLERQKGRRMFDKLGIDRKGKDVNHIKAIKYGGTSARKNLNLRDPSANHKDNKK